MAKNSPLRSGLRCGREWLPSLKGKKWCCCSTETTRWLMWRYLQGSSAEIVGRCGMAEVVERTCSPMSQINEEDGRTQKEKMLAGELYSIIGAGAVVTGDIP